MCDFKAWKNGLWDYHIFLWRQHYKSIVLSSRRLVMMICLHGTKKIVGEIMICVSNHLKLSCPLSPSYTLCLHT